MTTSDLTLRLANASDSAALDRLAQLDSQRPLSGTVLVAENGTGPVAALAIGGDGRVTADPFLPTAPAVELLRARARQLTGGGSVPRREHSFFLAADAAAPGGHP